MINRAGQEPDVSQHISQHDPDGGKQFHAKFERVMAACGVRTDSELARILDIKPSSVGAAKRRLQLPPGWIEQIAQKFAINADWLFFGVGPMRRGEVAAPAATTADQAPPPAKEDFKMSDMLTKTAEVLESETIYRTALASNINAFHQAVQGERLLTNLAERMELLEKQVAELQRENRELRQKMEPADQSKAVG